ncbi:MAG: hypothetical protein KAV98_01610 [Dehalococcoidia bacterium]|nr:hypothetical protein [Dehalococcoidia bacterium]
MDYERRITQHKRFVPYGTHPNFCFAKTSFMLETLSEIVDFGNNKDGGVEQWR